MSDAPSLTSFSTSTMWASMNLTTSCSQPHRHVLDLQVIADAGEAALAADAAVLDAAGRRLHAAQPPAVDPDRACLELAREPHGARDVARIDAGGEAIA